MPNFDFITITRPNPFTADGNNNYDCFAELDNISGVFVIQNADNAEVLYVGESGNLKQRFISFYMNVNSSFDRNWIAENQLNGENPAQTFERFKDVIRICTVKAILLPNTTPIQRRVVRDGLINILQPTYNIHGVDDNTDEVGE
jgi:hypothetical protein